MLEVLILSKSTGYDSPYWYHIEIVKHWLDNEGLTSAVQRLERKMQWSIKSIKHIFSNGNPILEESKAMHDIQRIIEEIAKTDEVIQDL